MTLSCAVAVPGSTNSAAPSAAPASAWIARVANMPSPSLSGLDRRPPCLLVFDWPVYSPTRLAGGQENPWANPVLLWGYRTGRGGSRRTRSEEHTSELQSLMRISYAVFCLKKTKKERTKVLVK